MLHFRSCNENPSSVLGFRFRVLDVLSWDFLDGIFSCSKSLNQKRKYRVLFQYYGNIDKN